MSRPALLTPRQRLACVVMVVALVWAVVHFSGLKSQISVPLLRDAFQHHRLGGLLLFAALFVVGNLIQVPGWLFLVAAVLALGPVWGGLATYFAACISCITTFWVVRQAGGDALRGFGGRLGARLLARLDAHPVQSVWLLRLVFQTLPALNGALALSGLKLRHYVLGTLAGLPLPILLYCVFFDYLAQVFNWPVR
jgi:uncharacterized membrane protein YdjX (TVP38/TMEM64 family)